MIIKNPILTGFNPDPCMIYVNKTYYIAVSTFEWFPGVLIYSSKDLVNWDIADYPLKKISQLDMKGVDSSGGIWAPALSYSEGVFYLVYTNVISSRHSAFRDGHNYYVCTTSIEDGEWSEPTYLNSGGFDPSIYHEKDGTKWLLNTRWNYRFYSDSDISSPLTGILIQQLDIKEQRLIGKCQTIFDGTDLNYTEAPHLYKLGDWYYLITAEGGTSYQHSVTCARSKSLMGPYEVHPDNPLLTSQDMPNNPIQKAGHGSLCQGHDGRWYLAHLCGRPIGHQLGKKLTRQPRKSILEADKNQNYRCILGRETAIQMIEWKNDWPYLAHGGNHPLENFEVPSVDVVQKQNRIITDFDLPTLPKEFQTLRVPLDDSILSLKRKKGVLSLRGCDSPGSKQVQSIVGCRQTSFSFIAETKVDFQAENLQQLAGLMYRYNEDNFYYLNLTFNEKISQRVLNLMVLENGVLSLLNEMPLDSRSIFMRMEGKLDKVLFFFSDNGETWNSLGDSFDSTIISDEFVKPYYGFTGAFICLACHDWSGQNKIAEFDYFKYINSN